MKTPADTEYDYVCEKLSDGLEIAASMIDNLINLTQSAQAIHPGTLTNLTLTLPVITLALERLHAELGASSPSSSNNNSGDSIHAYGVEKQYADGTNAIMQMLGQGVGGGSSQSHQAKAKGPVDEAPLMDLKSETLVELPPIHYSSMLPPKPKPNNPKQLDPIQLQQKKEAAEKRQMARHLSWLAAALPGIKKEFGREIHGPYTIICPVPDRFQVLMSVMHRLDINHPERRGVHGNVEVADILSKEHADDLKKHGWSSHKQLVKAAKEEGLVVGEHDYECKGWHGGWCGKGWIAVNWYIVR